MEQTASTVRRDQLARRALLEVQVQQALPARPERRDPWERVERLALQGLQARLDRKVIQVLRAQQEQRERLGQLVSPVPLVLQDRTAQLVR